MTNKAGVGAKVKKLREDRLWSQEKLAEVAEVSARTVQRLESRGIYSPNTLNSISQALDIDPKELISAGDEAIDDFIKRHKIEFIPQIRSGNDLCNIVGDSDAFESHNDELEDDQEVEVVGSFLQETKDIGDIWEDIETQSRIELGYKISKSITECEQLGFCVFAQQVRKKYIVGLDKALLDLKVSTVAVLRKDSSAIHRISPSIQVAAMSRKA